MLQRLRRLFARIIAWQKRPIAAPAMATDEATCKNCGHTFVGNYCPRCGQSRATYRIGSPGALRIFLDTWGMGSNSLLRTIWNLIARPGYMIGDYLEGHRQPYFPPFKTLFVIGTAYALTLAFTGGFERMGNDSPSLSEAIRQSADETSSGLNTANSPDGDELQGRVQEQFQQDINQLGEAVQAYEQWQKENMAVGQLLMYALFAAIAWGIFRKAPRRPGLRLSEHFIAQVYMCAQTGALSTLWMWLQSPFTSQPTPTLPGMSALLLTAYDYKQLYGYGLWRTLWKTLLSYGIFIALTIILFVATFFVIAIRAGISAT